MSILVSIYYWMDQKGNIMGEMEFHLIGEYYLDLISKTKKVILAGGLNPQNVTAAILETNVDMVDVSSGVETNGQKDLEKIKTFVTRVKNVQFNN